MTGLVAGRGQRPGRGPEAWNTLGWMRSRLSRPDLPSRGLREPHTAGVSRRILPVAVEVLLAVGVASGAVAALQSAAPPAGLGVVYLLAVLEVAVRRGQRAALVAALLGVLVLNYFFIAPRQALAIAHTQDLVELAVFLIAALVVGRLAARERLRAAEAESRARLAAAREQEAELLAAAASAILSGRDLDSQLAGVEKLIATTTGASGVALVAEGAEPPSWEGVTVRVPALSPLQLRLALDSSWEPDQFARLAEPLGKMIDVARARERAADQAAEIEAAQRAETARTAVLHAISHDLRSPLTAITTAGSALGTGNASAAEQLELIDVINGEAARLARLVDDLLDLSQIEAGAVRPRADWCDLHDIVTSAAGHPRRRAPDHLRAAARPAAGPRRRGAAAARVLQPARERGQVLAPARADPGPGRRHLGTRHRAGDRPGGRDPAPGARACVRAVLPRPNGSGSGSGSGLGLAICRGFVEANGGRIVLQADAGQGTSFAVSFPTVPQPETVGPAAR